MKKKLLTLLLLLLPIIACAESVEIDGINYLLNVDLNEAEVIKKSGKYSGVVVIPETVEYGGVSFKVTSIGEKSFEECVDLTSVVIGGNIVSIGAFAFNGCTGLTTFTIPENVKQIEQYFLSGCSNLESLVLNCDTIKDWFGSVIGKQIKSVSLGDNVKVIGEKAFSGFKALQTIDISSNLNKIDNQAFEYCSITYINIHNLKSWCEIECGGISSHPLLDKNYTRKILLFNGEEITDLVLDNSISEIKSCAFSCTSIKSVSFTSSVSIAAGAFGHCSLLSAVYSSDLATWLNNDFAGIESNPLCNGAHFYIDNKELNNLIIPNGVQKISNYSFAGLKELLSLTIPSDVSIIGDGAFKNCENLKTVSINEGLKTIGNEAFSGCEKLNSIYLPNSLLELGGYSFYGCRQLQTIKIPDGITSIEASTFYMCDNLAKVDIGNGVKCIGASAFFRCKLTSIDIPDNVTTIKYGAFDNCFILNTVVLGKSIKEIGENAFSYCGINQFFCYSETIPSTNEYAFRKVKMENAILYVADSLIDAYKQDAAWRDFRDYKSLPSITYYVDNEVYKSYTVKCGYAIILEPAPAKEGYTFSGWSDNPGVMPYYDLKVYGTFSVNKYKLTYMVDGAEYKSYDVEYGAAITPEPAPTKDGYTFSGWSDIPESMPANDIIITGTFSAIIVTKYTLTYKVDGEVYKTYELEKGTAITPEPAPTKEGYTFSGWSDIPETMPANDVTITGTFSINKYKLIYMVDGAEYKSYDVEYGAAITPEEAPTKEGYTFSGWSDIPETMPAKDVVVTGSFSAIEIKEDTGEFTATSGSTAELSNDNNVSGEYEIPETVIYDGVTYTVTSIGNEAFKDNTNLTDVTIPSTITSIGESAFAGCSNLKSITVNSTTPIAFPSASRTRGGSSIFEGVDKNACILYVPEGSVELYKAAPVWSEFQNILAIGSTGINGIIHNGEPQDVYDLKGRKVKAKATSLEGLPRGIYIINGKKIIK